MLKDKDVNETTTHETETETETSTHETETETDTSTHETETENEISTHETETETETSTHETETETETMKIWFRKVSRPRPGLETYHPYEQLQQNSSVLLRLLKRLADHKRRS